MLKLFTSIPLFTAIMSIVSLVFSVLSFSNDIMSLGIVCGFAFAAFGILSIISFRVQSKITAVADVALDLVGKHAEKVADAVVEHVKKKA